MPTSTSSTSDTAPAEPQKQTTTTGGNTDAMQECPVCHSLRGQAPEGLFDVHSAFNTGNNPGDAKWQSDNCWHCGAKYS